jgi:GDPmannose 4,6-dehydratase
MWRMLQADEPDDFVLATGSSMTVRDFMAASFGHVGLSWEDHVRFDERYLRPSEVDALRGDPSKAERTLGWKATVDGTRLAQIMVDADLAALEHEGRPWIDSVVLSDWPGTP